MRRISAGVFGAVVLAAVGLVAASPSLADGECKIVGNVYVCEGGTPGTPGGPTPTPPPDDDGADDEYDPIWGPPPTHPPTPDPYDDAASAYYYTYEPATGPCPLPDHVYWWVHTHLRSTGEIISSFAQCIPTDQNPSPDFTGPGAVPQPPSTGQFANAVGNILSVGSGISPPADGFGGVSQLDTWFWCVDPQPPPISIDLGGWSATAAVQVELLTWTITGPDGSIDVDARECGSEPDPYSNGETAAATWTPNLPGDYTIALTVEWGGTWTRTFGGVSETLDMGTVTIDEPPIDYSVVEIQTVGRGN